MAIEQPLSTDPLNNPAHHTMHQILGVDLTAPVKSLVVDSTGKVGIGTTEPGTKLDVSSGQAVSGIQLLSGAAGWYTAFTLGRTAAEMYLGVAAGANNWVTGSAAGDIVLRSNNAKLHFGTDGTTNVMTLSSSNVGIGITLPTAVLHLKAGTTTANTAPLKFNSGDLLTAAEAGAMEFLTDAYYLTTTTGAVRRTVVAGNIGRAAGQTAAVASVATYTLGASDASYEVSANVLVTTSNAEAFTVTCAYTDEGNTARVITLNFQLLAGTIGTAINSANGAVPYEGIPIHIRCKASTAITIATTGVFTGVTYNVEGIIKQIG